ncbi:MAG: hypothetical protein E6Q97_00890 [Desulfurellales bacterium]|nr:MAG: hypothetical protein E6Q97_00890 [Desulfurellales bacterium]
MSDGNTKYCGTDYYRDWSATIGSDGAIQIRSKAQSMTMTAAQWIDVAQGMRPESEHREHLINAIHWHFGPSDAAKVLQRYIVTINAPKGGE